MKHIPFGAGKDEKKEGQLIFKFHKCKSYYIFGGLPVPVFPSVVNVLVCSPVGKIETVNLIIFSAFIFLMQMLSNCNCTCSFMITDTQLQLLFG